MKGTPRKTAVASGTPITGHQWTLERVFRTFGEVHVERRRYFSDYAQ
jgi:hypothetical protein